MLFDTAFEDEPTLILLRDVDVTIHEEPPALPFPLIRRKERTSAEKSTLSASDRSGARRRPVDEALYDGAFEEELTLDSTPSDDARASEDENLRSTG